MKPTREQVIAWAREAGIEGHRVYGGLVVHHSNGGWINIQALLERVTTLAYEAGRKDENEDCAKVVELECIGFRNDDEQLSRIAAAIRTRRKQ